jgi:hypothetical protein
MSSYFTQVDFLPRLDLQTELDSLISNTDIFWVNNEQICVNTTQKNSNDFKEGTGSLIYDWTKKTMLMNDNGKEEIHVPKRENQLEEKDFKYLCSVFENTLFQTVYTKLQEVFHLGRVRLIKSKPKSCLTWHYDFEKRLHYPIKTQEGCFMVIDDKVVHLPKYQWCLTETTTKHTAVNASKEERIHLVACILGEK